MSSSSVGNTAAAPTLKRALGLWDLVMYGIIVIQPTAPMPGYGVFANASQGQVVTCILIGMVAMVFTAISYGRMARVYPSAGSAYTYVGREIHRNHVAPLGVGRLAALRGPRHRRRQL